MSAPTNIVRRLPLLKAIETRLDAIVSPPTAPMHGYVSEPVNVPTDRATGFIERYWVLHPYYGGPTSEQDLADTAVDAAVLIQITCVAAFPRDALAVASLVDAALYRWRPEVPGHSASRLRPPDGFEPGPPRPDKDFTPRRYFLPLQYVTTITRS